MIYIIKNINYKYIFLNFIKPLNIEKGKGWKNSFL